MGRSELPENELPRLRLQVLNLIEERDHAHTQLSQARAALESLVEFLNDTIHWVAPIHREEFIQMKQRGNAILAQLDSAKGDV